MNITNLTKAALNTKATEIENKIPHTIGFITTPEFNRLTKINFDARMKEVTKNLANKSHADAALEMFHVSFFTGKSYFEDNGS